MLVDELSSPGTETFATVSKDGLEVFLTHDGDLWMATRKDTSDPWSPPVNLGPVVNSSFADHAVGPFLGRLVSNLRLATSGRRWMG